VYRRLNQSTYTIAHHQSKHLHIALTTNQSTYTLRSPPISFTYTLRSPPIKAPTQCAHHQSKSLTHCAHHQSKHLHNVLTTKSISFTYTIAHHQSKHLHIALTTNQSTYTMCSPPIKAPTQLLTTYLFRGLLLLSFPFLVASFLCS
jgi:hypothetical protein